MENTEEINIMINTFVESKKIRLAQQKCARIHVGNGHENCLDSKVHEHIMKETESEKYLGDVIHQSGNIQETINRRKEKGIGIVAEILYIINEIPLGKHRVGVALKLREVMFINGIFYNS